jgi:S-DNA-T family DNA segregation ATPase FtsK/SpoIIIE
MTAFNGRPERVVLPRGADVPGRHPFPVLASLAPLVGAVVIWAITSSPFALVFAVLGPVIAVASLGDSRMQASRQRRREAERVFAETLAASDAIEAAHDRERLGLEQVARGALATIGGARDAALWRASAGEQVPVVLGRARVPSSLVLEGDAVANAGLVEAAACLDAPLTVDARQGIGLEGGSPARRPVLRSLALQVAAALSPATTTLAVSGIDEPWLLRLPHRVVPTGAPGVTIEFRQQGVAVALIAEAGLRDRLPLGCGIGLTLDGGVARVDRPGTPTIDGCRPELVSLEQANACAAALAEAGAELAVSTSEPPARADFADLGTQPSGDTRGLDARFCVAAAGALAVDLVREGPHAIIGGTTGSGKSELLVSWLLAMAAERPPAELSLLLVDFKGGASFAPIADLPHVVGLVTDLDERTAARALLSLRAEVQRRERALAAAGVREISALQSADALPRLVIVIDEFAAVQDGFDDLHRLVGDLASRGRSLGVHLVLCTQRPAGVIRDAVFANVRLRLSLAVTNQADSIAVIGSDAAARLSEAPPGRVLVSVDGGEARAAQVALVSRDDVRAVIARWLDAPRPRRPWCDDLPHTIRAGELPASDGHAFGLADLPREQRQESAAWDPASDGSLLLLGSTRSGRTGALATLCAATGGRVLPVDAERAWDAVVEAVDLVRSGHGVGVIAVDDLDVLVARLGAEHGAAFIDLLVELARVGPAVASHLAVSMRRTSSVLQPLVNACEARLLLRMPDRHEHSLAGGDPALFAADAPPGRGEWRGRSVQVAVPRGEAQEWQPRGPSVLAPSDYPVIAVITRRVRELTRELGAHYSVGGVDGAVRVAATGDGPTAIVADPESWQAAWAALGALRGTAALVFDGCTPAEFRAISGSRILPSPVRPGSRGAWLLAPDGTVGRVLLPSPAPRPGHGGAANGP